MNHWMHKFGLSPTGLRWMIIMLLIITCASWFIPHDNVQICSYQFWYGFIGLFACLLIGSGASLWQSCVKRYETYYRDR